jgi:hypothetical protein
MALGEAVRRRVEELRRQMASVQRRCAELDAADAGSSGVGGEGTGGDYAGVLGAAAGLMPALTKTRFASSTFAFGGGEDTWAGVIRCSWDGLFDVLVTVDAGEGMGEGGGDATAPVHIAVYGPGELGEGGEGDACGVDGLSVADRAWGRSRHHVYRHVEALANSELLALQNIGRGDGGSVGGGVGGGGAAILRSMLGWFGRLEDLFTVPCSGCLQFLRLESSSPRSGPLPPLLRVGALSYHRDCLQSE